MLDASQKDLTGKQIKPSNTYIKEQDKEYQPISDVVDTESDSAEEKFSEPDFAFFRIDWNCDVKVDGVKEEWLSTYETVEYKNHLNSMYGGGGCYKAKDWEELKKSILHFFFWRFKLPYVAYDKDFELEKYGSVFGSYICDIKSENIKLLISPKAIDFLKRNKIAVEELLKEIEKMRKNRAEFDEEYQDKMVLFLDTEKLIDKVQDKIRFYVNFLSETTTVKTLMENSKQDSSFENPVNILQKIEELKEQLRLYEPEYKKLNQFFRGYERGTLLEDNWVWKRLADARKNLGI